MQKHVASGSPDRTHLHSLVPKLHIFKLCKNVAAVASTTVSDPIVPDIAPQTYTYSNVFNSTPTASLCQFLIPFFSASCFENCEKKTLGRTGVFSRISTEVLDAFKNKQPYVYLQFAYFRVCKVYFT